MGSLAELKVPLEIFVAFVVSVVADVARPDTAPDEIAIAVLVTDVILPVASTTNTGTEAAAPWVAAVTPDVGSLVELKVPLEIFVAFVVSVVADVARPDTAPDEIAIAVLVTDVILPVASTTNTGTEAAAPWVAAVTPDVGSLVELKVPLEIFVAFVVSVVADAARPDTAPDAIAIAVLVTDVTCPEEFTTNTGTEAAVP